LHNPLEKVTIPSRKKLQSPLEKVAYTSEKVTTPLEKVAYPSEKVACPFS
jgi:hypothetical protein